MPWMPSGRGSRKRPGAISATCSVIPSPFRHARSRDRLIVDLPTSESKWPGKPVRPDSGRMAINGSAGPTVRRTALTGTIDVHAHAMPLPLLQRLADRGLADLGGVPSGIVRLDP